MRRQRGYIKDAVFGVVAVSGMLLVSAVAPNTLRLLDYLPGLKQYRVNEKVKSALASLCKRGLISFENRAGKRYVRLTEAGKKYLVIERYKMSRRDAPKRKWDGRWRIVMFDIPEKRRRTRDAFRSIMKDAGFVRFQDSAWIYPYDCEDLVALLKADLRLGNAVRYVIADTVENDASLRTLFSL